MGKHSVVISLILIFLLAGCQKVPAAPTHAAEPATTVCATDASEETTAPAEPVIPQCLLQEREHLSYEEFFAADRLYADINSTDWLIPEGDHMLRYRAVLDGTVLRVQSEATEEIYTAACDLEPGFQLLAADGKYAYILGHSSVQQIDLLTGTIDPVACADEILFAQICGRDVLYYAQKNEAVISIRRVYLPTGQNDLLFADVPGTIPTGSLGFSMNAPGSTLGTFSWSTVNPEMMALVLEELANPESDYRTEEMPPFWEQEDPLSSGNTLSWLIIPIQERSGIRGLLQYTYNQADGSCTQATGIVDNCWVGSAVLHDHFAEDPDQKNPAPKRSDMEWTPIAGMPPADPPAAEEDNRFVYLHANPFRPYQLYLGSGDIYERHTDLSFTAVTKDSRNLYGITSENTLVRISYKDGSYTPLYTGQYGALHLLNAQNDVLYFADGDHIIQLDVYGARYRSLVRSEHITYFEIVENGLYLDVYNSGAYFLDLTIERLFETTPHL